VSSGDNPTRRVQSTTTEMRVSRRSQRGLVAELTSGSSGTTNNAARPLLEVFFHRDIWNGWKGRKVRCDQLRENFTEVFDSKFVWTKSVGDMSEFFSIDPHLMQSPKRPTNKESKIGTSSLNCDWNSKFARFYTEFKSMFPYQFKAASYQSISQLWLCRR
jgi:hypothetical protein